MLRLLPGAGSYQLTEHLGANFCSEQSATLRNLKANVAGAGMNLTNCFGCSFGSLRVGVTERDVEASCSFSRGGGLGFRVLGVARARCVPGLSFSANCILKANVAGAAMNLTSCGCILGPLRVGLTGRYAEASCSFSGGGGLGFRVLGVSRARCVPGLSFFGDLDDVSPVDVENLSLVELLEQVGAGEARDARGMVQIEANPHPSLIQKYAELDKPFERGRALPIPMPHKMNRPFPLPLSRHSAARKSVKPPPSSKPETLLFPRLFAKLLVVPDDEVRMVLGLWKGRSRCKSDAISRLMRQLGRRDCTGKALQLFAWVREQPRLWPNEGILLAIIQVVLESRKLTLANKFLVNYGPLSPESALVAVNSYVEEGFIKDALRILKESRISAGSELYAKMIVKAGEGGARDVVQALAVDRCFRLEDCARVMATCSRLGLDDAVEAVFQRYTEQELKPNIVLFTTLMQARARAGNVRQALAVFWDMQEAGVKPDLIACRVMIRLCEKVGDVNRAVKVYNEMRISGFVPTPDVYNAMIRLYCREGRLAKAKEVIREMEMWGCAPTSDTNELLSLAGYKLP